MKDTAEQLESRKEVNEFMERMKGHSHAALKFVKSSLFGRPDAELQGWIERGRAWAEVKDTAWYQLQMAQTEHEIRWAQAELETCNTVVVNDLRCYLKALRFVREFILTTERNADIASSILAGRPSALARDTVTFVKNAVVNEERN